MTKLPPGFGIAFALSLLYPTKERKA